MKLNRVILLIILVGVSVGVAAGYAVATATAVSKLPFMELDHSARTDFDRALQDFSRLGAYESAAADCGGTSDKQLAISKEAEVIRDLQQRKASDTGLLNLAEAKFLVRTVASTEKISGLEEQTSTTMRVEGLLRDSGWTNPSEKHLREIIQELDHDQCRQVAAGGR